MKRIRAALAASQALALLLVAVWVYSSSQVNAIAIGGRGGEIDFWIGIGDIAFYVTTLLWASSACFLLWAWAAKKLSSALECFFWLTFSLLSVPVAALCVYQVLSVGIRVDI